MSVRVMTAVWEINLPASDKIVLLALADCANDEGLCWPGMATLVEKCSKGERTIQAAIQRLVTAGHLTRKPVPGKGVRYIVHPDTKAPPQNLRPAKSAPRKNCAPPPQNLRDTPAKSAGKPSKNHQEPSKVKSETSSDDFTFDDFFESWNQIATECGLSVMPKALPRRREAFRVRKREYPDIGDWQSAFRCLRKAKWMHGENDRGWKIDADDFLNAKKFTRLVEGTYAQAD